MNRHYNFEHARMCISEAATRASQEGPEAPPLLTVDAAKNLTISEFHYPKTFRAVLKENPEEEAYFRIVGAICSKVLPPLTSKPRIQTLQQLRNLRQFVKVTGFGHHSFEETISALHGVVHMFESQLGAGKITGQEPKLFEGDAALDCHARYFTDRELAPQEKHQAFDKIVDPKQILEDLRGADFIHGPDNRVEYCKKIIDEQGQLR
ncbi:hypothetical protein CC1G_04449 [Coprinopsis cinerea okayama7|uniref:Uncharacterized protein n=1 Tax=Coprinopsis cinerea (strain Okayama-7 / 130 / ATCC MYA-4618 / FGSC 9003) TaxID=240176 RepID=A8N567_COPC7|nr:hypothetical protein CC1G_04449 [Coprinopsis cinerea okayama7\|eukprot:XP_001830016.2 hypothetical protein CC1G_04449 [Coprinopsis cinerea okayama7\